MPLNKHGGTPPCIESVIRRSNLPGRCLVHAVRQRPQTSKGFGGRAGHDGYQQGSQDDGLYDVARD